MTPFKIQKKLIQIRLEKIMKQYNGFLIDLDGTMYRGTEVIQEAGDFVNELKALDLPYLFVTNNSSRTPLQVAEKLKDFGIAAEEEASLYIQSSNSQLFV